MQRRSAQLLKQLACRSLALRTFCTSQQHTPQLCYTRVKRFSTEQVKSFLVLTGDTNAIHEDHGAAQAQGFSAPIVPGMLLASLFPAVIGSELPGSVYLSQTLTFKAPALVDDEVIAQITVLSVNGLRVKFETRLSSQDSLLVDGTAEAMVTKPIVKVLKGLLRQAGPLPTDSPAMV